VWSSDAYPYDTAEFESAHVVSGRKAEWADTRGLARKYAEAKALEMMQRFVANATPADILKMQQMLDVVRDDKTHSEAGNVMINIGMPGHPIALPKMPDRDGIVGFNPNTDQPITKRDQDEFCSRGGRMINVGSSAPPDIVVTSAVDNAD
jgi:hypothetical protein